MPTLIAALYVPGEPVAQPRQRHRIVGKGANAFVQNYTPKDHPVNAFKAAIQRAAKDAGLACLKCNGRGFIPPWDVECDCLRFSSSTNPIVGPLKVDIVAVFPRQSAKVWKTRLMPRYRHTTKPDRDNVEKAIYDALTGLVWRDDSQVCAGSIEKWHAAGGEAAHTLISIWKLDG